MPSEVFANPAVMDILCQIEKCTRNFLYREASKRKIVDSNRSLEGFVGEGGGWGNGGMKSIIYHFS